MSRRYRILLALGTQLMKNTYHAASATNRRLKCFSLPLVTSTDTPGKSLLHFEELDLVEC